MAPWTGCFPEIVAADYHAPGGANAPEVVTAAVSGIELSWAMTAGFASKPGGDVVDVTIGDMTSTRVAGRFSLVYLVSSARSAS